MSGTQRKYTLITITADGVVIQKIDHFAEVPTCAYRLINNHKQRSWASPDFMEKWKSHTLPNYKGEPE